MYLFTFMNTLMLYTSYVHVIATGRILVQVCMLWFFHDKLQMPKLKSFSCHVQCCDNYSVCNHRIGTPRFTPLGMCGLLKLALIHRFQASNTNIWGERQFHVKLHDIISEWAKAFCSDFSFGCAGAGLHVKCIFNMFQSDTITPMKYLFLRSSN